MYCFKFNPESNEDERARQRRVVGAIFHVFLTRLCIPFSFIPHPNEAERARRLSNMPICSNTKIVFNTLNCTTILMSIF